MATAVYEDVLRLDGHGSMNARLARFGLADIDRCSFVEVVDWWHMRCYFLLYEDGRYLESWGMVGVDGVIMFDGALDDAGKFLVCALTVCH